MLLNEFIKVYLQKSLMSLDAKSIPGILPRSALRAPRSALLRLLRKKIQQYIILTKEGRNVPKTQGFAWG